MLDKAMAHQKVWIFENNAYDQNMPLFQGTVNNARIEPELRVWDFLMCEVEFYDCSHGILDIRVSNAKTDTTLNYTNVFLVLCFGDSVNEEIVVPMVERNGSWRMK